MISARVLAALLLTAAAASAAAADWRYSVGIHDFAVPDMNSDTYGSTAASRSTSTPTAVATIYGSAVVYLDHDQDDIDPSRYSDLVADPPGYRRRSLAR
jgi:hypothetical protein